jgi:hypothetical protein
MFFKEFKPNILRDWFRTSAVDGDADTMQLFTSKNFRRNIFHGAIAGNLCKTLPLRVNFLHNGILTTGVARRRLKVQLCSALCCSSNTKTHRLSSPSHIHAAPYIFLIRIFLAFDLLSALFTSALFLVVVASRRMSREDEYDFLFKGMSCYSLSGCVGVAAPDTSRLPYNELTDPCVVVLIGDSGVGTSLHH